MMIGIELRPYYPQDLLNSTSTATILSTSLIQGMQHLLLDILSERVETCRSSGNNSERA
jgi:hypothetical protein